MKYLIVVDMQVDFITGSLGSELATAIVQNVVEKVKSFDGKVIFTRDTHFEDYMNTQEGKKLPVPHCIKGTDGWKLNDDIAEALTGKKYTEIEKIMKDKGYINLYAVVAYAEEEDEYITHDSVIFHEVMGYKTVGRCNKCGFKFGRWYDILYMEKFIGTHK